MRREILQLHSERKGRKDEFLWRGRGVKYGSAFDLSGCECRSACIGELENFTRPEIQGTQQEGGDEVRTMITGSQQTCRDETKRVKTMTEKKCSIFYEETCSIPLYFPLYRAERLSDFHPKPVVIFILQ